MEYDGVKFYSANDFSSGYYLEKAQSIITEFKEDIEFSSVNQIIELFNIQRYFDNKIFLRKWSDDEKQELESKVQHFSRYIARFWSKVNNGNFEENLSRTDFCYLSDFWFLFAKFKVYERISSQCFKRVLHRKKSALQDILVHKQIVKYFNDEIRDYILTRPESAQILLDEYACSKESIGKRKYFFPEKLTKEDKEKILFNYINWKDANPNYLKLIFESQSTNNLPLTSRVKLQAKRQYRNEMDKLFDQGTGISYGSQVCFSKNQDEEVIVEHINREVRISYSSEWVKQNRDYPTLLNNFIYLFEFTDLQFRILHVSKLSYIGTLEKF